MTTIWAAALLVVLIGLGITERRMRDRALRTVTTRIHVNGTRGKSTVTRLIAAALREAGITTLGKTTGTEARLILPDGRDEPVRRRATPSIREQLWVLRRADRIGARAVVAECMAIDPGLQRTSEQEMLHSTLGVVTNVRHDHGELMGTSVDEIASALAGTVPRHGVVVLGDPAGARILEQAAAGAGSRVVRVWDLAPAPAQAGESGWMRANRSIALAVTRQLGIADEVALRGMENCRPDPGAMTKRPVRVGARAMPLINATAANDPDSLEEIIERRAEPYLFVFHHRADRPFRLRQFADAAPWSRPGDVVWLTGDRPDWMTWRRVRRTLGRARASIVPMATLAATIRRVPAAHPEITTIVCCGNTRGFDLDHLQAAIEEA